MTYYLKGDSDGIEIWKESQYFKLNIPNSKIIGGTGKYLIMDKRDIYL